MELAQYSPGVSHVLEDSVRLDPVRGLIGQWEVVKITEEQLAVGAQLTRPRHHRGIPIHADDPSITGGLGADMSLIDPYGSALTCHDTPNSSLIHANRRLKP